MADERLVAALLEAANAQFQKEKTSLADRGAVTDLINKGFIAGLGGAPVDLINMGLTPLGMGSAFPFGGSEHIKRAMEKYGVATKTERPIMEAVSSLAPPRLAMTGARLAGQGLEAAGRTLAPVAGQMAENYMGRTGMRLSILEGGGGILDTGVSPSLIGISSDAAPILPRSSGMYTPGIAQENLQRLTDAGKVPKFNERTQGVLESGTARKKTTDLISKGKELGIQEWYGTEPLRQFALNEGLTQAEFDRMLAHLASASQRNPVSQQNRMGSVLWKMDRQGELNPDVQLLTNKLKRTGAVPSEGMIEFPPTYGSLAQGAIFDRSKKIASGDIMGALPTDKKLGTFYQNLKGNLTPVTVDVNALRGPVMASKRPDWLATKLVEKDEFGNITNSYTPRSDYDAGLLTMKDALSRPGFWEAAPKGPGEYSGIERLWQNAAKREGVAPAEAQALGWYGSGDITALKSKPELYIENLERLARITAEREGISPVQAMRNFVLGKKQLGYATPEMLGATAVGGASAAALADALAKQK